MIRAAAVLLLAIAVLAVAGIAFGQALVIFDGLAVAHPAWEPWQRAVVALGFELAVLVTGVAIMVTGADRKLVAGEILLVGLSIAVGLWMIVAGPTTNRWIVALSLGLLPAQYLVATYSLHRLYVAGTAGAVVDELVQSAPLDIGAAPAAPFVAVQVNNQVNTAASEKAERQARLRQLLGDEPRLTTSELVAITGASKATIARDLAEFRRQEAIHG